ncbi:MAG: hypothetical protein K5681_00925 [Treponema sp.]|nr:hypothetical protein [Treponema sp.]
MFNRKKHLIFAALLAASSLYASTFFSGYAGGKLNFSGNSESEDFDPDLKLQAFFAGQFSFTPNTWAHLEFSVDTDDLLTSSIFEQTSASFQIDELSYIIRGNLSTSSNYFSAFMGTYDPIGSDVFLQRYFSIEPIASKLTESYMGLAGSILYPQFGFGIADIIRFNVKPMAFGGYLYLNHEDEDYFVLNADLRYACVYRYFTCDFAGGIGIPLANQYKGEDVIVAVDTVYWHAGTTMLVGNNYTHSLFLQAGLYNVAFTAKNNTTIISPNDLYLLFEPRFVSKNFHLNFTAYSIPEETCENLLFIDDTLGADLHLYAANVMFGPLAFTVGGHLSFSIPDKTFIDFADAGTLLSDGYNINFTPYITCPFLSGELHLQGQIKIMEIATGNVANSFSLDLGYRTKF